MSNLRCIYAGPCQGVYSQISDFFSFLRDIREFDCVSPVLFGRLLSDRYARGYSFFVSPQNACIVYEERDFKFSWNSMGRVPTRAKVVVVGEEGRIRDIERIVLERAKRVNEISFITK